MSRNFNCTPPLLATGVDQICNDRFYVGKVEGSEITELFWNNYLNFEPSLCKTPCTETTYEVHLNSIVEFRDLTMKLTFEPLVHVTHSMFSTTVIDVLTSLGGAVSDL